MTWWLSLKYWRILCLSSLQEWAHPTGLLVFSAGEQAEQTADYWAGPSHPQSTYLQGISLFAPTHAQLWSGSKVMNINSLSLCSRVSARKSGFPHPSCKACGYPTAQRDFQLHSLHSETSTLPTSRYRLHSAEKSLIQHVLGSKSRLSKLKASSLWAVNLLIPVSWFLC